MCLAVPGKIISIGKEFKAEVDFGGVIRAVQLDLMPDVKTGEYVIVHAGFAIQRLTEEDALETMQLIKDAYGSDPLV
jgi:hydrogenase expression/formation protein HypC